MNGAQSGQGILGPQGSAATVPAPCGSGRKFKQCCEGRDVPEFGLFAGGAPTPDSRTRLKALRLAASEHARFGRWEEALKPLADIARLDPDNAQSHHDLGYAQMRRGFLRAGRRLV